MNKKITSIFVAVSTIALSYPALSETVQSSDSTIKESKSGSRLLEEVLVTAQKRSENIKDVPISISAYSAGQLDAKMVMDVADLPKITPGLNISALVGLSSFFLRGVGSDATVLGDPLVVTYIDNVYFPSGFGQLQDFGSVENIEILKGPQGTLFGRNALGGAIRVQTKDPSLEHVDASISQTFGSHDLSLTRAYFSTPLGDTLAISVSGVKKEYSNHIQGLHSPFQVPLPIEEQESFRTKIFWQPTDWMDLRLNYYELSSRGGATYSVNTQPSPAGTAVGIQARDARHGQNNEPAIKDDDVTTYFGQLSFYSPWFDIKLFASDQSLLDHQTVDFDGSIQPIAVFEADGHSESRTAEIQFLSNTGSPANTWFEWIVGAYYFEALQGFDPATLTATATDINAGTIGGIPIPPNLLDLLITTSGVAPVFPAGGQFSFVGQIATKSTAYYAQTTTDFTDWMSLTLGARYQVEDRYVDDSTSGLSLADGSRLDYQSYNGYDDSLYRGTTTNFDPKVSLNFRPNWHWIGEDAMLYLSYQTATTSLTFNAINIYDTPERVESTEMTAYEAGIKTRFLHGTVDINAAIFDYTIDNPQVQTISLLSGGAVRFENAESQRIQGFEFDSLIQLFPNLTNNSLILTMSGSYLDAIYSSFKDGSGFNQTTGVYEDGQDFSGNRIVRTPKYSGTLGLMKTFSTHSGPIEVSLDYYMTGDYSYLAQGTANAKEPAYSTLGANISYLYEPWNVRLALYGRNILNEEYAQSRFLNDFGTNVIIAPLATYGMRLNWAL